MINRICVRNLDEVPETSVALRRSKRAVNEIVETTGYLHPVCCGVKCGMLHAHMYYLEVVLQKAGTFPD
jgi:hypothetical protein